MAKGGPLFPKIEERIGVKAPASVVWEVIRDIEDWGSWNPMYSRVSGKLRIDDPVSLTLTLPDREPREVAATIVDWVPDAQILWAEKRMYGQVTVIRFIEIDALSDESCIFANGEQYRSWYLRFAQALAKKEKRATRAGFLAFCEAVRDRAEALWREQGGRPT